MLFDKQFTQLIYKKIKPNYVVKGKEYEKIFNQRKKLLKNMVVNLYLAQVRIYFPQKKY